MCQIKIVVAGPRGRMGREAIQLVTSTDLFQLVAVVDNKNDGKKLGDLEGFNGLDAPVYENVEQCFETHKPDVLIDLTTPKAGMYHTKTALQCGVRPVVGTTGFSKEDLEELETICKEKQLGCIIAPNFAISAVLMMKFSRQAAKYFPNVEIIELHHDQKLDAPSGTAVKTAQMISEVRIPRHQGHPNEKETIPGARGANFDGMHIHSVRLPGLIGHQQVLFGSEGEALTIRHDSYNRASFMTGVKLAVETVMDIDVLVYGLENIID